MSLLLRQHDREFAVADADGQPLHELRYRVLAVGADQFGERRKQAGLGEAIAVERTYRFR